MSILLMTEAFKAHLPTTRKFLLVALCDSANDQGECYPSIPALALKCSMGERTVQEGLATLEKQGFLRREFRTGRSTVYWIADPRGWRTPADAAPPQQPHHPPADAAPPPPQQPHHTPAAAAPITVIEPSVEPSRNQRQRGAAPLCPPGVDEQVWEDFQALRRSKRAPLTATALSGIEAEALRAGIGLQEALTLCCQRGWTGFKAAWLRDDQRTAQPAPETAYERRMREKWEQIAPAIAAKRPGTVAPATTVPFIDMEATNAAYLLG